MAIGKVEICGVNTATLPTLGNEEKEALFQRIREGDEAARKNLDGRVRSQKQEGSGEGMARESSGRKKSGLYTVNSSEKYSLGAFSGAELEKGILVHAGALRWNFFRIVPGTFLMEVLGRCSALRGLHCHILLAPGTDLYFGSGPNLWRARIRL